MNIFKSIKEKFIGKINSKKADNRGAGMVTVMVAIVFIGIMATSLCYMAYMNYLTKTMKYYSTDNFYTDEYALSDLTASLQQIVVSSDSIPAAINNLRVACTGSSTGTTYKGSLLVGMLDSVISEAVVSIDDGEFQVVGSNKVILKQVRITTVDWPAASANNTYTTTICTDIILSFATQEMSAGVDVNDFSVIAGADLDYGSGEPDKPLNLVFGGNIYCKGEGGNPAINITNGKTMMLLSDYAIFDGDVNISGKSIVTMNGKVIIYGNLYVEDGSTLIVNGEVVMTGKVIGTGTGGGIVIHGDNIKENKPISRGTLSSCSLAEGLLTNQVFRANTTGIPTTISSAIDPTDPNSPLSSVCGLIRNAEGYKFNGISKGIGVGGTIINKTYAVPSAPGKNYRVCIGARSGSETLLNGDLVGSLTFEFKDAKMRETIPDCTILTTGNVYWDMPHNYVMTHLNDENYELLINTCIGGKDTSSYLITDVNYYDMIERMESILSSGGKVYHYSIKSDTDELDDPLVQWSSTDLSAAGMHFETKMYHGYEVTILVDSNGEEVTAKSKDRFVVTDASGKTYIPAGYLIRSESSLYISNILALAFNQAEGTPYASVAYDNWKKE